MVQKGDLAPEVRLVGTELNDFTLDDFAGKQVILSVVPSLDTSTCALQTKRFDTEAQQADNVVFVSVSIDTPFAISRWRESESCLSVVAGSDFKYHTFGQNYGVYIEELGVLARAVFVIGENRYVRHVEYVANLSREPNYEAALEALR